MWPQIDKRKKRRRHLKASKNTKRERRISDRRKYLDWIDLYLKDDEPDIS